MTVKSENNSTSPDIISDLCDDISLTSLSLKSLEDDNFDDISSNISFKSLKESDFLENEEFFSDDSFLKKSLTTKNTQTKTLSFEGNFSSLSNDPLSPQKETEQIKNDDILNLDSLNLVKENNNLVSGFTTAQNKKIFIKGESLNKSRQIFGKNMAKNEQNFDKEKLKNNKIYQEFYNELYGKEESKENKSKLIETGFTTGNKKTILIKEENLNKKLQENEICKIDSNPSHNDSLSTLKDSNEEERIKKIKKDALKIKNTFFPSHYPFRSYQQPEKGHISDEQRNLAYKIEIYNKVKAKFTNEDKSWLFYQFKFSWMSLFMRSEINQDCLDKIINQIQLRKRREYSILRRIAEGDDVSYKYMVLLVLKVYPDKLEVYDGSYSILCSVDKELSKMLLSQKIKVLSQLKIFNAELLIKPPFNILENDKKLVLHLNYNSIKLTQTKHKLGYQKKCTFVKKLKEIHRLGGIISCLNLMIVKVIEEKMLIKCFDYKKEVNVNEIEKEIEKIMMLAKQSNKEIKLDNIRIIRYIKCLCRDDFTECMLIWYNPNDEVIKKDDKFRFINVRVNEKSIGLTLTTIIGKTFVQKIN
ncbi:hypothetical protein H312_01451, partial [Anncaliia algerae PRA339]